MDARQIVNATGDWLLQRSKQQVVAALVISLVSLVAVKGCTAWRDREAGLVERGRQEQRDSAVAATITRLQTERDSARTVADSAEAANHVLAQRLDSASTVWKQHYTETRTIVPLARADVRGDTVYIRPDPTPHAVDHPVAEWIDSAVKVIQVQDSLLHEANYFITTVLAQYRASVDSTLDAKDAQIVLSDSLARAHEAETRALRAKLAEKPSRVSRVLTWAVRAGALCGAYSLGARKPCWRIVLP